MLRAPVLICLLAMPLSGCTTLGYYAHTVGGQLDILGRTESIEDLLDGHSAGGGLLPPVSSDLRGRLATVLRIRAFATEVLALPDNGSYRQYVELDREAVAWNVIATPEFSLAPERWCYPFAGCVPYRGYFSHQRARRFAEELRQSGRDVRIARVAAYSTLGWFQDPILSTQLKRNDVDLAALLFHELAHQELYVPDDAAFNESFATVVEQQGLRRWLVHEGNSGAYDTWRVDQEQHARFIALLQEYRGRLERLYASGQPPDALRREKAGVFAELRGAYQAWRTGQQDVHRYDAWFAQDLNNAHLAGVDLYHRHVPAFEILFRESGSDFRAFYRAAHHLARLPPGERHARLAALARHTVSAR